MADSEAHTPIAIEKIDFEDVGIGLHRIDDTVIVRA